jgi:hypothetical protein
MRLINDTDSSWRHSIERERTKPGGKQKPRVVDLLRWIHFARQRKVDQLARANSASKGTPVYQIPFDSHFDSRKQKPMISQRNHGFIGVFGGKGGFEPPVGYEPLRQNSDYSPTIKCLEHYACTIRYDLLFM